jgi:hypothetical protein
MKLGSKKTKQAELLDALGGDVLGSTMSGSNATASEAPIVQQAAVTVQKVSGRGSLPEVEPQRLLFLFSSSKASYLTFFFGLVSTLSSKNK